MATLDKPILSHASSPDATGKAYWDPIEVVSGGIATATLGQTLCLVLEAPATAGDVGVYGSFQIPKNYVGTPIIVVEGVLEGNSGNIAFGASVSPGIADNETIEVAYEVDVNGATAASGYSANDKYVETIALTPAAAYVAGDTVYYFVYRDDTADSQTTDIWVSDIFFRYNDA